MQRKRHIFSWFISCVCLMAFLALIPAYAQSPQQPAEPDPTSDQNRTHVSVGNLNEAMFKSNFGFYIQDFKPQDINREHITVGNINRSDRRTTTDDDESYPYGRNQESDRILEQRNNQQPVREQVDVEITPALDEDSPDQK